MNSAKNLTFGEALQEMRSGNKVSRNDWNEESCIFLKYVHSVNENINPIEMENPTESDEPRIIPGIMETFIILKTARNSRTRDSVLRPTYCPWSPSHNDLLANDWYVTTKF